MWPPNHKMRTVGVAFSDFEDDHDTIKVEILDITHDQVAVDKWQRSPDWSGIGNSATASDLARPNPDRMAKTTVKVKAERNGGIKAGRTYSIRVRCTDTGDVTNTPEESEDVTVYVRVPHSRRS